jgi:putative membrane protein
MGSAGATSAWMILLWTLLGLAVVVTAGILAVRALHARQPAIEPPADGSDSAAVRRARDVLRLRYASGEISREDYLQGKVELED